MSSTTVLPASNSNQRRREAAFERRPEHNPGDRVAWTVAHWAAAVDLGQTKVWELIATGEIEAVNVGKRRLILTHPAAYVRGLMAGA
jgi:hypothetical protein